jgi:hypothetical protein
MRVELYPGQRVPIPLPSRIRASIASLPDGLRLTAMVLTFDSAGRHVTDEGSAADVDPNTLKLELEVDRPADDCRQSLFLVATRDGVEVPFDQVPQISLAVEGADNLYSWNLKHGPNRAILALDVYIHSGQSKLRSIDEGWLGGWKAFCEKTGCDVVLPDILEATLEEVAKSAKPSGRSPRPAAPASDVSIASLDLEAVRLRRIIDDLEARAERLNAQYAEGKAVYDRMVARISQLHGAEEVLEYAEMGVYRPHFEFGDSEAYKAAIETVRAKQKKMVSDRTAVTCRTTWQVKGDAKAGQQMIERLIKLTMRAFNGEADAAISNVRWNNVVAMEKRIATSVAAIDKANETMQVVISPKYVKLKLDELRLAYEYRERLKKEKDESAEARREQREQEKVERDLEAAEREERKYQMLLDKAREEAARSAPSKGMEERIAKLEKALNEATTEKERTQALAEQTKCGYVYVISNVGSFGEGIVKIGMTRRADPQDRVRELSSASVPFSFDTHAMAYSPIASELEAKLHREFADSRVNVSNNRKEFFRCTVDEVERAVARIMPGIPFTRDREAREWRETMALRNQKLGQSKGFPSSI